MKSPGDAPAPRRPSPATWLCLLIVLATAAAYGRLGDCGFVDFDDPLYVTENRHVLGGIDARSLAWAFTTTHGGNWHPLTWVSHMLDAALYGDRAGGHHLTSLVLHGLNAVLLFLLLRTGTGRLWAPFLAALLFALHPTRVESVAWVSERKDVLSTFFGLLALVGYFRYARSGGVFRYLAVCLLFAASLASKPMLVTLPFLLLLLDAWPLGRVDGLPTLETAGKRPAALAVEKLPLLALSAASCWVTFAAQQAGGAVRSIEAHPLGLRLANALLSYLRYLGKLVWPRDLAVVYPFPPEIPPWQPAAALLVLSGITLLCARRFRTAPHALVGWLWFLGTLVPVIGLVQVGSQSMADRYTYFPFIGLFIVLAWSAAAAAGHGRWRKIAVGSAAAFLVTAAAAGTRRQVPVWTDSLTLFGHAVEVTTGNAVAHTNLGVVLMESGRLDAAVDHFDRALRIQPDHPKTLNNMGMALALQGKTEAAMAYYRHALDRNPDYAKAHYNLAIALTKRHRWPEAVRHYREALRNDPEDLSVYNNLGGALLESGDVKGAADVFQKGLTIDGQHKELNANYGVALYRMGETAAAEGQFRRVLALDPGDAGAYSNLGFLQLERGMVGAALGLFETALKLDPGHAVARDNHEKTLAAREALRAAADALSQEIARRPEDAAARRRLAEIYRRLGREEAAAEQYRRLSALDPGDTETLLRLARLQAARGAYREAEDAFRRLLDARPDDPLTYYYLAAVTGRQHRAEEAVDWLRRAIAKGYPGGAPLEDDPNFAGIRDTAAFRALLRQGGAENDGGVSEGDATKGGGR